MKRRRLLHLGLWAAVILALPRGAFSLEADPGSYGSITDFMNNAFGIDPNAGLTAFPILNIPMGGKAESMAGAFAAVASDVSAVEWNPAWSSVAAVSEAAFFHNAWIADTSIDGIFGAHRFGNLGISGGTKWLYTPFTEYDAFGERASKGYYAEGIAIANVSYNFFPSYYFYGVSVGASVKAAFRSVPDFSNATNDGNAGETSVISGSGKEQSAIVPMGDVGILTRFNFLKFYYARERNFSVALVARNFGPPAMGDALPTVFVGALSWKPLRPILLSFDWTQPVNLHEIAVSEKPYCAAGLSVAVANFLSMSAGVQLKAGGPRLVLGTDVGMGPVSLNVNYTLDLATQMQPFNRVSLGLRFNLGDGGRKARADKVDALYHEGLAHYSRGEDAQARALWHEALSLDPGYVPAQEGIKAVDGYRSLTDRIRDINDTSAENLFGE